MWAPVFLTSEYNVGLFLLLLTILPLNVAYFMRITCPSHNYDDTDGGWSTNVVLDEYFEVAQSKHVGHCETVAGREKGREA